MATSIVIAINIFGVLVSLFSISVTLSIYQKYRLPTSLFFVLTGLAVFIWNVIHLIFNFIPEETDLPVRLIWLVLVYSGITFFYMFVFGYSNLRYENLNWRLILYSALATAFSVLFATQETWVTVEYDVNDGWVTLVEFSVFWSLFSLSLLVVGFIEIIIPLVNTYARATYDRQPLFVMLVAVLLALFSNALEPLLQAIESPWAPQAIRFLVADIGFFLFFVVLLRYPFTGLYDTSIINQVIVADENGVPKLSLSPSTETAILTSGAIIGINAILDEITSKDLVPVIRTSQINRKIELGLHQFYIIIRGSIIIAFQFQNPTGVCYAKFNSLARIFSDEYDDDLATKIEMFISRLKEYFVDFTTTSEQEETVTTFTHAE